MKHVSEKANTQAEHVISYLHGNWCGKVENWPLESKGVKGVLEADKEIAEKMN